MSLLDGGFARWCCSTKSKLHIQNLILVVQPVRHWYVSSSKKVKTKESDFFSYNPSRWAGCIGLIGSFQEHWNRRAVCTLAHSKVWQSVECNIWCWGIGVHSVYISGWFFLVGKLIPGWLHGLNACLCWSMLSVLLVLQLTLQFCPKKIWFIHFRTASWCTVSGYNKELLLCAKKWR